MVTDIYFPAFNWDIWETTKISCTGTACGFYVTNFSLHRYQVVSRLVTRAEVHDVKLGPTQMGAMAMKPQGRID